MATRVVSLDPNELRQKQERSAHCHVQIRHTQQEHNWSAAAAAGAAEI